MSYMPDGVAALRVFTTPSMLEDFCQLLNDSGLDCSVPLLDALGQAWLTYGEDHTSGGEACRVWMADVAPMERDADRRCEECNMPLDQIPLDESGLFPMIGMLNEENTRLYDEWDQAL